MQSPVDRRRPRAGKRIPRAETWRATVPMTVMIAGDAMWT